MKKIFMVALAAVVFGLGVLCGSGLMPGKAFEVREALAGMKSCGAISSIECSGEYNGMKYLTIRFAGTISSYDTNPLGQAKISLGIKK